MRIFSKYRTYIIGFWVAASLALTSYYNACSQAVFEQSAASKKVELNASAMILINKDAPYANSTAVEVNVQSYMADEVYVTNDPSCASGGNWEPLNKSMDKNWTLGSVNQEVTVYARFRSANEGVTTGCLSDQILHDNENPVVVLQEPKLFTNVATPIFYFLAGDTLSGLVKTECEWPGQSKVDCQFASSNGNIAEKRYLVKVTAYDRAGNISDPIVQDLIVDRTPPVITLLNVPSALSNSTKADFTFNVQDNLAGVKSIECAWDSMSLWATCASPLSQNLAEGAHTLYLRSTDFAGNTSAVKNYAFNIDLTAPQVTILTGPKDFSNSSSATFTFEGRDGTTALTVFECKLDGGSYVPCSTPKSYSGLSEGVHTFSVRAQDNAGNFSSSATRSWYVDLTPPAITWVQVPPALSKDTAAVYKYSVADSGSGVDRAECSLDGAALAACAIDGKSFASLAAGNHTFKVRAYDKAANYSEKTNSFKIDLTAPTVQFTRVPDALSSLVSFNFGFSATDDTAVARVECRLDAAAFSTCNSLTSHMVSGLSDGTHRFTIRGVDTAGNISAEVSHDWTVDATGPVISYFQLPPAAGLSTSVISLGFTAADGGSGVKTVTCTLNGTATSCLSGVVKSFSNLAAGAYTFVVTATDNSGNVATDTRTWNIQPPVLKNQAAEVKENKKLDILVIIDNSGSMGKEQKNMGSRFQNFTSKITGIDWQIGVITTDVSNNANLRDGRIVGLDDSATFTDKFILNSTLDPAAAQLSFQNTVQMSADGSGQEWGLKASIRSIERAFDPTQAVNQPNARLFRADAMLAMIVVSDALDDSGTSPEQVINLVKAKWPAKPFVFHSIVVPESAYTTPNSSSINAADPCGSYRESARFDGRIYHQLSDLTGGIKGTVCSEDYSAQLAAMGQATRDLVNSLTLDCNPVDANADGQVTNADIVVTSSTGSPITDFTLAANKLTFTNALPIGVNQLSYYCVQ